MAKSEFKADLKLKPKGSQGFLLGALLLSGTAFVTGCIFLWSKPALSWIPFLFSIGFLVVAYVGWRSSNENADFGSPVPTTLSFNGDKIEVKTASQNLVNPKALQGIETMFSVINHRRPLPPAQGLVSSSGEPIADSEADANDLVAQINEEAAFKTQEALTILRGESKQLEDVAEARVQQTPPTLPGTNVIDESS